MQKRRGSQDGFSLTELMIAMVIIGIFSALAIPSIMEVRYRNSLTEMVNLVERTAVQSRNISIRTRRAAVLEMTESGVWINHLQTADCWSPVIEGCLHQNALDTGIFADASAAMCGGVAVADSADAAAGTLICSPTERILNQQQGFALCYSGRGELFVRTGADANTSCTAVAAATPAAPVTPVAAAADWNRSCSSDPNEDPVSDTVIDPLFDGAVITFNRHEGGTCEGTAISVRRLLLFPTAASPYSKVTP